MTDHMRRDWVLPILEDVRNFLDEAEMAPMARDLDRLMREYGEQLQTTCAIERPSIPKPEHAGNLLKFPVQRR
ncbi:MAG: hypothetical protein AAF761_08670 [Pseudomonadota bacterium]